ncbi:hypothetical protein NCHU2750_28050 [Neorhizobium sp. NCHU2750]|nr:hypothetical protein NCHU2750_28050 [Neorhizobium sp. NCHU2750]
MNKIDIRMECLRLALAQGSSTPTKDVEKAEAYYKFVTDGSLDSVQRSSLPQKS